MIINYENLFLIILGLVWIIGAVLQDLKRREVDNLWNFSLIAFALAYRLAISIFHGNYWFILNGIIGLGIFLILGNLFYYLRLFAGGDAKLVIALGAILPLSYDWLFNLKIFGLFILLFLIAGSIYALIWALFLVAIHFKNFSKEFVKESKDFKRLFLFAIFMAIIWIIFMIFIHEQILVLIGILILLFPVLFIFAKSVETCCMVRLVEGKKVTEGDWLVQDVKIGKRLIKSNWEGVSKNELFLIKKSGKKVLIKYGIPFTPAFLIAYIFLFLIIFKYEVLF